MDAYKMNYPTAPYEGNYTPPPNGYPPFQGGYPPSQYQQSDAGYPPVPPGYPTMQGGYPPPQQGGYPPPPPGGYPPPQGGYPPPQGGYPPPHGGYPPPQGGYPPPQGGYPPGPVITNQPVAGGGWMNMPHNVPNCPPGLEYLSTIDQLLVHQKVELLEAFTGFETANKYTIKNSLGQKIYFAGEESDCCSRNCCGPLRQFDMKILDNMGNQVIRLHRPLACDSCLFPCCLQSIEVSSPPGNIVGSVVQEWSLCCPSYAIKDSNGETVLRIDGPLCRWSSCGDVEFKVMTVDGSTEVGKISKQWSGLIREMFTDADTFGITFPMDLDVRIKAVLMGACFLIDAMFFEKSQNKENDGPSML